MAKGHAKISSATLAAILKGTHKSQQIRLHDGGGLYLKPNSNGGGFWSYRYQVGTTYREIGIGSLGPVSAADARSKAQQLRDQRRRGGDPLAEMRAAEVAEAKAKAAAVPAMTFDEAAAKFGEQQAGAHRQTVAAYTRWREAAKPLIGNVAVTELKPSMVADVVVPYYLERYETGKRMLQWMRRVIALGKPDDDNTLNAADKGRMAKYVGHFKKGETKHRQALPWADVPSLVAKLWTWDDGKSPRANCLLAVILSGLRAVEAARTEWDGELDFGEGVWMKPAAHMKMRRQHAIPLSTGLLAVFDRMRPLRDGKLVFPGLKSGQMIDEDGMLKLLRELGYDNCTVHGFRSSVSDWGRKGDRFPEVVMKRVIAHGKNSDDVFSRYNRDQYFDERVAVMQAWSDHCLSKLPPGTRGHLKIAA